MADKLLFWADTIVVLEAGRITGAGDADSIRSNHDFLSQIQIRIQDKNETAVETEAATDQSKSQTGETRGLSLELAERDPSRRNGDFSVYRYYVEACGYLAVILFLFFMLL